MRGFFHGLCALILLAHVSPVRADSVVTLEPMQDNTLYETAIDGDDMPNERSNGAGNFLFVGRTGLDAGFKRRRALLKFDLSSLPPGTVITAANLTLFQSKAAPNSPPAEMALHRLLQNWGEGDSKAITPEGQGDFPAENDATWHHRLYPSQLWLTQGGHFEPTGSAVTTVGQELDFFIWACTADLVSDVQGWLDQPETHHGWIIVGGEIAGQSAHRFNSRENTNIEQRPLLQLKFRAGDAPFKDGFEAGQPCG